MPPRLTKSLLSPLFTHNEQFTRCHCRLLFSTTAKTQVDDPLRSLMETIGPARTARPSRTPITSRSPSVASDSNNPALRNIPPASQSIRNRISLRTTDKFLNNNNPSDSTNELISTVRRAVPARGALQQDAERKQYVQHVRQIEAQATRNWHDGDVYSPHDLSPVEMQKAKFARLPPRSINLPTENTRKKGGRDVLDDLGIDPLKEYKNFAMMSEFMTELGRIRHSRDTGFRAVNQRRMAKAVRRAIGIGIMPSVHRHPELMEERQAARRR